MPLTADVRIIPGLPADQYHRDPAPEPSLSTGVAKILLSRCPLAAWRAHPKLNPEWAPEDDDKFAIGTVAHALLLEDDDSRIVEVAADDWRTKAAQQARIDARTAGKIALLARQADDVRAMVAVAKAFLAASEIGPSWADAVSEQTILWREPGDDGEPDVWLRVRPDRLASDRLVCMDYKTTACVAPEVFTHQIATLGYHIQDALYRRGIAALGGPDPKFVFLAQETAAPFDCALYGCDPLLRQVGESQVERAIGLWRDCLRTGNWPGYGTRVMWATAPYWLQKEIAEDIHG